MSRPIEADLKHACYPADIRRHVESLRHMVANGQGDFENWHGYEDAIHQTALEIIMQNGKMVNNSAEIAKEALRTKRIKFQRVCA